MSRKHVLAAVLAAGAIAPAAASAAPPAPTFADHAIIARDIIPSGEYGDVPPPAGADQQAQMYDALTPLFNHVTNADLPPTSSRTRSARRVPDRSQKRRRAPA